MNDTKDARLEGVQENVLQQDSLKSEFNRLITFSDTWPKECPVKPLDLAKAGFYFTNSGDTVKCFSCGQSLSHWQPDDDPYTEHKTHFGDKCDFIKNPGGSGNVPVVSESTGVSNQYGLEDEDSLDLNDTAEVVKQSMTEKGEKRKLVNGQIGDTAPKSPRVDGSEDHTLTYGTGDDQTDSVCRAPPRTGKNH